MNCTRIRVRVICSSRIRLLAKTFIIIQLIYNGFSCSGADCLKPDKTIRILNRKFSEYHSFEMGCALCVCMSCE